VYNLGGLAFAVNGLLTPLIAAVLMPLSSLTIFAIAVTGTTIYAARRRNLMSVIVVLIGISLVIVAAAFLMHFSGQ
jgi:hypothetical protein